MSATLNGPGIGPGANLSYSPITVIGGSLPGVSAGTLYSTLANPVYTILSGAVSVSVSGVLTTTGIAPASGVIPFQASVVDGANTSGEIATYNVPVITSSGTTVGPPALQAVQGPATNSSPNGTVVATCTTTATVGGAWSISNPSQPNITINPSLGVVTNTGPLTSGALSFTLSYTTSTTPAQVVSQFVNLTISNTGGSIPPTVAGFQIGQSFAPGTGTYLGLPGALDGFTIIGGDDFTSAPTQFTLADNPTGNYAAQSPVAGTRNTSGVATSAAIQIDPYYRGSRSQSGSPLGLNRVTQSGSIVSLTEAVPESTLLTVLPTNYSHSGGTGDIQGRPLLATSFLYSYPSFTFSAAGNWVLAGAMSVPVGPVDVMLNSIWACSFNWPNQGELDMIECSKAPGTTTTLGSNNVVGNANSGAPSVVDHLTGDEQTYGIGIPNNVMVNYLVRKINNVATFYDDISTPGQLQLRTLSSSYVSRFLGAWDVRLSFGAKNNSVVGDYPQSVGYDYWFLATPIGQPANIPTISMGADINTTPGGSWAATVPAKSSLWGGVIPDLEEAYSLYNNVDTPGWTTKIAANNTIIPAGGMSINLSTRQISGTVPLTEGGRAAVMLFGSFNNGGAAYRAVQYYNVAPAVDTLFPNNNVDTGTSFVRRIPYNAFHSGDLGPHTYNVTSSANWVTITGNGTGNVELSGTVPAVGSAAATITVACTNVKGQTTTATRTLTPAAAFTFTQSVWPLLNNFWDPNINSSAYTTSAGSTVCTAGSTNCGLLKDQVGTSNLSTSTTGAEPAYITDTTTGLKTIKHTASTPTHMTTAINIASLYGGAAPFTLLQAVKKTALGVSEIAAMFSNGATPASSPTQYNWMQFTTNNSITYYRQGASGSTNLYGSASESTDSVSALQWYIIAWIYSGNQSGNNPTVTVRVNGVTVVDNQPCSSPSPSINTFSIGAGYDQVSSAYLGSSSVYNGAMALSSDAALSGQLLTAEAFLAAEYGVSI